MRQKGRNKNQQTAMDILYREVARQKPMTNAQPPGIESNSNNLSPNH
jgi:hypothetical protein